MQMFSPEIRYTMIPAEKAREGMIRHYPDALAEMIHSVTIGESVTIVTHTGRVEEFPLGTLIAIRSKRVYQ